jgi:hypothetical protein
MASISTVMKQVPMLVTSGFLKSKLNSINVGQCLKLRSRTDISLVPVSAIFLIASIS